MDTMMIKVPANREWKTLTDVRKAFSEAEVVEMVHRYCNQMDSRREYRTRKYAENKALLAWARTQKAGTRVDMSAGEEEEEA